MMKKPAKLEKIRKLANSKVVELTPEEHKLLQDRSLTMTDGSQRIVISARDDKEMEAKIEALAATLGLLPIKIVRRIVTDRSQLKDTQMFNLN